MWCSGNISRFLKNIYNGCKIGLLGDCFVLSKLINFQKRNSHDNLLIDESTTTFIRHLGWYFRTCYLLPLQLCAGYTENAKSSTVAWCSDWNARFWFVIVSVMLSALWTGRPELSASVLPEQTCSLVLFRSLWHIHYALAMAWFHFTAVMSLQKL